MEEGEIRKENKKKGIEKKEIRKKIEKKEGKNLEKKQSSNFCPYFKKCGGCKYLNLPYKKQIKIKQIKYSTNFFTNYTSTNLLFILPKILRSILETCT